MEAMELVLDGLMAEGEEAAAVVETPEAGEQVDGEAGAGEQEIDPDTGEPINKGQDEGKQDGRKNPDAIRKHLAALKANPETAELGKEVTNRLGKVRGYEEVYPTVREAREVKALIDSVGGREAVTSAIESHATMQRVDQLLEAGDVTVLEDIFKQAPEGMTKLAPAILDKIAQANPKAYQAMITPHAVQMMQADGLPGAINALVDAFNSDNKAGIQDILGRIVQWYRGLQQGVKPKEADPERQKFEEEKSEFQKQQEQTAITQTMNANMQYTADKIDAGIAADIKRLGLGAKQTEKLRQEVWNEIVRRRQGDKVFTSRLESKFNGRKPGPDAVKVLNDFTDSSLKDAIDEVVTTIYGERKAVAKTGKTDPTAPKKGASTTPTTKAADAGWTKVNEPPSRQDIDYDHGETDTMNGKAVLKTGKKVQWR